MTSCLRRRFVIQKHDATRLHDGLRLEFDGVSKSWAAIRGLPLDPRDKRLTIEVQDHLLDYSEFRGHHPEMPVWRHCPALGPRLLAAGGMTAEAGLASGDLKFTFYDNRLQGSWIPVRIKNDRSGSKRINWLLIKHRDHHAQAGHGESAIAQETLITFGRAPWTRSPPAAPR